MERIEKTVFLSYRRTNIPWALAIFQNLTQHGYDVFFDYNGIARGDFERVILGNIVARAHFLVLLTPSALERCGDPNDWLRREIEAALNSRRNTVPLMLEGFDFGTPKITNQLTGQLAALRHYNGLSIPPEYFLEAMGRLRDRYLNVALTAVLHPSLAAQRAAIEQRAAAEVAPAVLEQELTAQQWFERGFAAVDIDEQLRFYSEAIRLKPDYASAFNNRAVARENQRDHAGAIEDFNEAIRLKPDHAEAFSSRGNARAIQSDEAGAIEDYSPGTHSARVHRKDLVVKPREPRLILGHDLRIKRPVTISRRLQIEFSEVPFQLFPALPVARVPAMMAHRIMLLVTQVIDHLSLQCPLQHCLGQLFQQAVFTR
jgi:tetratricopeptide (TPR) repeat protein